MCRYVRTRRGGGGGCAYKKRSRGECLLCLPLSRSVVYFRGRLQGCPQPAGPLSVAEQRAGIVAAIVVCLPRLNYRGNAQRCSPEKGFLHKVILSWHFLLFLFSFSRISLSPNQPLLPSPPTHSPHRASLSFFLGASLIGAAIPYPPKSHSNPNHFGFEIRPYYTHSVHACQLSLNISSRIITLSQPLFPTSPRPHSRRSFLNVLRGT